MRLDKIAVTLRPRSAWEAIDLGYAMVQAWAKPVFLAWCAVYLPAAAIISLIFYAQPLVAAILLWWLKPAFERVVLHVLANATFGAVPTLKSTLRALPKMWWSRSLLAALTYQRVFFFLFLSRTFHLPVTELEMGRGKSARQRQRVLGREGGSAAVMLTIICAHLELVVMIAVFTVVYMLLPPGLDIELSRHMLFDPESAKGAQYLSNLAGVITISILEPFYVAGGFALYIHSRTVLEGWDVELAFKRMSARVEATRPRFPATGVVPALLVALLLAGSAPEVRADVTIPSVAAAVASDDGSDDEGEDENEIEQKVTPLAEASTSPNRGAREAALKVIAAPEFGREKDDWKIKYIGPDWRGEQKPQPKKTSAWMRGLANFIASIARILAWIGIAVVVGLVVVLLIRHFGLRGWGLASQQKFPDVLFGLDIRPESLPDDVPAAARAMLARGDLRGATGLLYRGALVSLMQDGRIEIARGDTEGECVAQVTRMYRGGVAESAKAHFFGAQVALWQRIAYAAEPVAPHEVSALIDDWASHFAVRRDADQAAKSEPVAA